ncbi:MAG: lipopolysaccharide biosynthesis protein [Chloroflexi bacterium]|nr:MAG: lipopolysaccharide biosynthesis protein [Chloroflexota bacterium]
MKDDELKYKTARGSLIMGAVTMLFRPINIIGALFLMRLLNPEDFGAVALALILLTTSSLFSALGLETAIIQSSHDNRKIAFPSFVITMGFATILFLILNTNILTFARLLGDEEIVPILRWLSLLILIDAAYAIPAALTRKQLMFGKVGIAGMLYRITYTTMTLTLAFLGYGVWSLVYANLISSLIHTVAYFWLSPGWDWIIPRRWDMKVVRDLLRFGIQSTFSTVLHYLHTHVDDWLVGRYLGKQALGYYSKAYDFSNNTVIQISDNVVGIVFLPSYTQMQHDPDKLTRAYLKSVQLVLLIVVPLAFGVLAIAPEMVWVLWGAKWAPMIPIMQIFALLLLTRPIASNTIPLFQALGKPDYNTRNGLVLLVIMIPLVLLFLSQGIAIVAIAIVISHFIGAVYNMYQVNTILPGSSKLTIRAILPPILSGFLMMLVVFAVKAPVQQLIGGQYNFLGLFLLIGIGGVVFLPFSYLTQKELIMEIWNTALSVIGKRFSFIKKTTPSEAV